MAPEQARGSENLTPATDIWALGCVLYECLTGVAPFCARDTLAILASIVIEDVVPPRVLRPDTAGPRSATSSAPKPCAAKTSAGASSSAHRKP
jgi:serine/threonine protein kinase